MVDTIVIGAGTAGCVLAARLSEDPGRSVLLLEAGRDAPEASDIPSDWVTMFNTRADWGFHTEPQAGCRGRPIFWPRGRMVGGSGALNAMIYMRGLPSDYDGWADLGCPGWAWDDVLPWFRMSEDNATFRDDPHHGTGGPLHVSNPLHVEPGERLWVEAARAAGYRASPDFNGAEQEGIGFFQLTVRGGERWGTAKAYLRPALARANLELRTGVTLLRVLIEKGRAVGVDYLDRGRVETASASCDVVLAAGAIGSPHLLLLSGIGPADALRAVGVTPVHDLPGVGQHLQDHINAPITFAAREGVGVSRYGDDGWAEQLRRWREERAGARTSPWVAAGGHVRTRGDVEPDIQLYGCMTGHRDHVRFLHSGPGVTLHATLQRPRSRGEIRLRSDDPTEAPAIDPCYFASDPSGIDLATLIEGIRINRRIAATAPLEGMLLGELSPSAEAESDAALADHIRGHCTTLYHPAGTCRMGTDDGAVTDPTTFGVRGLEGLRVADAAVMPRMISANLNATTVMIAERAARAISA